MAAHTSSTDTRIRSVPFDKCCRLCLFEQPANGEVDDNAGFTSAFESDDEDGSSLQVRVAEALGIQIQEGDKLSTMICSSCIAKINKWQSYQVSCKENQRRLEKLYEEFTNRSSNNDLNATLDTSISIKEELIDPSSSITNGNFHGGVKNEVEEEFPDFPPPLTPHGIESGDVEVVGSESEGGDDDSQQSQETVSEPQSAPSTTCETSTSLEEGKIEFAAGLKLLQRNNSCSPSVVPPEETLTKMEQSYMNKCKAMVDMQATFRCACHNTSHTNHKSLFSHLRFQEIWFPKFTCFHCMMTFPNRSANTRHHGAARCPNKDLRALLRLAAMKSRSDVKIRMYQNFKCADCGIIFTFHDDFRAHIDEEHSLMQMPFKCRCGTIFETMGAYKKHAYLNCMVEFLCDICRKVTDSLEMFEKHAVTKHDQSEGFSLEKRSYDSSYRNRHNQKESPQNVRPKSERVRKRAHSTGTLEEDADSSIVRPSKRERRQSMKPPVLDAYDDEDEDDEDSKRVSQKSQGGRGELSKSASSYFHIPAGRLRLPSEQKLPGLICPVCRNKYSTNNNMWRHYKVHVERNEISKADHRKLIRQVWGDEAEFPDDSCYCCPDCGGMFSTQEWEEHKNQHRKKKCGECGKIFQFQSELDQHRAVHLNLKLYRDSKTQNYKSTMASPNGESPGNVVFMCDMCDHMCTSPEQLQEHKTGMHAMPVLESAIQEPPKERKLLDCRFCDKQYVSKAGLWDHNNKMHNDKKPYDPHEYPKKCTLCDKSLSTKGAFTIHRQMHERMMKMQQQTEEALKEKEKTVHVLEDADSSPDNNDDDGESYHTCKRCFKVFALKSHLKMHMKSHGLTRPSTSPNKKGKKVWCDVCHGVFESQASLDKHKLKGHGDLEESEMPTLQQSNDQEMELKSPLIFTCNICVATFTSKIGLRNHKLKHAREMGLGGVKPGPKPNPKPGHPSVASCKYCRITFASNNSLALHMKNEHDETPPEKTINKDMSKVFTCEVCRKVYPTANSLQAHMVWHKRRPNNDHVKNDSDEDSGRKFFRCKHCGFGCASNTALQIHILEKHRNVNTFVLPATCKTCSIDFNTQEEYEQHKNFHQRPYANKAVNKHLPCTLCPGVFARGDSLRNHMKNTHGQTGPNEFRCPQCNRVFDKQNSLIIHLKVHEKQKMSAGASVSPTPVATSQSKSWMFACSICNAGFDLPKDLRTHTIQAHPF